MLIGCIVMVSQLELATSILDHTLYSLKEYNEIVHTKILSLRWYLHVI